MTTQPRRYEATCYYGNETTVVTYVQDGYGQVFVKPEPGTGQVLGPAVGAVRRSEPTQKHKSVVWNVFAVRADGTERWVNQSTTLNSALLWLASQAGQNKVGA